MKKVAIEGDLSYFPLVEIFYLFSRFMKTGRLIIKERGNIYISDGKVIHAETESLEGMDAFFSLSMLKKGKFQFQPDEKPSINTISESLSDLIDAIERRIAELEEFKKDLPPLSTVPEKSSKAPEGDKVSMKKDDWKILILANGKREMGEIIESSPLSELDTYKALSWLFKEGLLYDPEEKERVIEEGIKKVNKFLEVFGDGPWKNTINEVIDDYELDDTISLAGMDLILLKKNFPHDLKKTRNFFEDVIKGLEKRAQDTLGKLLVTKKMKVVNES